MTAQHKPVDHYSYKTSNGWDLTVALVDDLGMISQAENGKRHIFLCQPIGVNNYILMKIPKDELTYKGAW